MEILLHEIERLQAIYNLTEDESLRDQLRVSIMFLKQAKREFAELYQSAHEKGYAEGYRASEESTQLQPDGPRR